MFYKIRNGHSPGYPTSLVHATVGSVSHTLYIIRQIYKHCIQILVSTIHLMPSVVRDWNELPGQTHDSPSLNIFKTKF